MNNKGEYNGTCNISTCITGSPAIWYNSSTGKYYCWKCASRINYWSKKDHGVILCTEEERGQGND